jgi:hypothetical protein
MKLAEPSVAYLHSRGLAVQPQALEGALRSALDSLPPFQYTLPGEEGLSDGEAQVLREGGLRPEPARGRPSDPIGEAVVDHARLLATGLDTAAAGERLGVSDARVRQRIEEGSLLALRHGRSWRLPEFQFTRKGELPGWAEVCRRLPADVSPVALERWLLVEHPDLGVGDAEEPLSPLRWLGEGRPAGRVAELAEDLD